MTSISIPPLTIPIRAYATQANAILGLRGSGKSQGAGHIAECLMDAQIPIIVFDPIGIWKNLKIPGPGPNGKGYPVVLASVTGGDLPLTRESAAAILRSAMKANVNIIFDFDSAELSKNDYRHIVTELAQILLRENTVIRHLFIEEAGDFVPQNIRPGDAVTYGAVESLIRKGGNKSLGVTIINPRAEGINKEVLELCDCLFLLRQKGRRSIKNLGDWLEDTSPDMAEEIKKTMPRLIPGQCWVWPQDKDDPVNCRFPLKKSFHPDRKNPQVHGTGKATDVSQFVADLSNSLQAVMEEAKANDPVELRKKIVALEKQLRGVPIAPKPEIQIKEVPILTDDDKELLKLYIEALTAFYAMQKEKISELLADGSKISENLRTLISKGRDGSPSRPTNSIGSSRQPGNLPYREKPSLGALKPQSVGGLPRCERAILTALAQQKRMLTAVQIAILTNYSHSSGGFNNALGKLRSAELISRSQPIDITPSGLRVLGDFEPLPTGDDLRHHWLNSLSKCEAAILSALTEVYPEAMTKSQVADQTGYSADSGGFNNALGKLRTLELINRGQPITASETLFQ